MILEKVIKEIRREVDRLEQVLRLLTGMGGKQRTRRMSGAGRKKISVAQKKRWAKAKAGKKEALSILCPLAFCSWRPIKAPAPLIFTGEGPFRGELKRFLCCNNHKNKSSTYFCAAWT